MLVLGVLGVLILLVVFVLITLPQLMSRQLEALKAFPFTNYTSTLPDLNLPANGAIIEKGNVKFTYMNPLGKRGSPDHIAALNTKTYRQLMNKQINEPKDYDMDTIRPPPSPEDYPDRANATILILVRNLEKIGITRTIRRFEDRFNRKFGYPYTFVNDKPFTDDFKDRMHQLTNAPCEFATIPSELWDKPSNINIEAETNAMRKLHLQNVVYALKQSYHNMCRFYLGNFYRVPELQKYKWYWRIEPKVEFYTDVNYDVFKYLEATNRIYGFTINLYDIEQTIELLWPDTINWLNTEDNYRFVNPNGAFQWLTENQQNPQKNEVAGYSTCHFWSNFEIADMDFFRGEAYEKWFQFLDSTGNFYYERWGDAPVRSLGLGLFANKTQLHWFRDIGYFHDPYQNCPNHENEKMKCKIAEPAIWDHLAKESCMGLWIDYGMEFDPYS